MAKQLYPECENIVIKTVQISRKEDEEPEGGGGWSEYIVVMGHSVDANGDPIPGQDIHEKISVGTGISDPWDPASIDNALKNAAGEVKTMFKNLAKDKADLDL